MIIDSVADLHGEFPELPGGDLLIVAGDWTASDKPHEVIEFGLWVSEQKYKRKIVIAGNHDNMIQNTPKILENLPDSVLTYLCDSGTEFEGLKIWGSPWTLTFPGMNPNCMAFTVDTEEELAEKWALISDDTDILITHCPRYGMHDEILQYDSQTRNMIPENVGSKSLLRWVANHVNTLQLHVYGHIHERHGIFDIRELQKSFCDPRTPIFVNASHVNEKYQPVNKPIRVIL